MNTEYRKFLEDKNRLIDKLDLTSEQKEELKAFFKKHPNYEAKIDWNNKSLKYEDFKDILALEGASENSKKKYGLSGKAQIEDLVEGIDYDIIAQSEISKGNGEDYTVYHVKTFKGSEVLAKPSTPPEGVTGHWCIAGRNYSPGTRDQHWEKYKNEKVEFFFIFTDQTKFALAAVPPDRRWGATQVSMTVFDCNDHRVYGGLPGLDEYLDKIKEICNEIFIAKPIYGPAGGFQFYDKGFESRGWRYIECAPYDLERTSEMTSWGPIKTKEFYFGYNFRDQRVAPVFSGDWENTWAVGQGKNNTEKLIKAMGDKAAHKLLKFGPPEEPGHWTTEYAAKACADFELNGYKDWCLPNFNEMEQMKKNLFFNGLGNFDPVAQYWTSTEDKLDDLNGGGLYAMTFRFNQGNYGECNKGFGNLVRPIRYYK